MSVDYVQRVIARRPNLHKREFTEHSTIFFLREKRRIINTGNVESVLMVLKPEPSDHALVLGLLNTFYKFRCAKRA